MQINQWIKSIADAGRELMLFNHTEDSEDANHEKSINELCEALFSNKGEALGTALASEVCDKYKTMTEQQRHDFFMTLLTDYSANAEKISDCTHRYLKENDLESFQQLSKSVEPPRQHLLRRINMAPNGTRTLVKMRSDLLRLIPENQQLALVDEDFRHLLTSWFNPGFLMLEKIDWASPAETLEKLMGYEAVHKMQGWSDLKRRLDNDDRRCFSFFHSALPKEPLIFVQVALTEGTSSSVQTILSPKPQTVNADNQDTAIFYSISNCQPGLKGISFGNFLIKLVVMQLKQELPQLQSFSTLSPIPGFRRWIDKQLGDPKSTLISVNNKIQLTSLQSSNWQHTSSQFTELEPLLMELCAHYLYKEKRDGKPLDPVARFHLGNGASISRLNWLGDTSTNGLKQSAGILVNYQYDLDSVEANHEKFCNHGEVIVSKQFLHSLQNTTIEELAEA